MLDRATLKSVMLRPYQLDAVNATLAALDRGENPVCHIPTGGGKSLVIGEIARQYDGRVLVIAHREELLRQNESELQRIGETGTGIYSAGIGRRDADERVVFGATQSIYRRMDELQSAGPFGLILYDECHRMPPRGIASMTQTILGACPSARVAGFSATPYRLDDGVLFGTDETWFDSMPYSISMSALIEGGYLSPLVGIETESTVDTSHVAVRAGEFVSSQLSQVACEQDAVSGACAEICELAPDRSTWLVFCVDVAHTELVTYTLSRMGIDARMVTGRTDKDERKKLFDGIKRGDYRALVNCEVATTGSNIPNVDCVVLLRPTQSHSLVVQMIGRGARRSPETGKQNCLVLDMAGNLERHMPLDGIPAIYDSPKRAERRKAETKRADAQREREAKHGIEASRLNPLAERAAALADTELSVLRVSYDTAPAKSKPGKSNFVVTYLCTDEHKKRRVKQWLCLEYDGYPRQVAKSWFERREVDMPATAREALDLADMYPAPERIVVRKDNGWDRVVLEHFPVA